MLNQTNEVISRLIPPPPFDLIVLSYSLPFRALLRILWKQHITNVHEANEEK